MDHNRPMRAVQYRKHHDNAADFIDSALEELQKARGYFPINSTTEDFLRRAHALASRDGTNRED